MSHVSDVNLHIKSLEDLRKACDMLGLEFREGQKTYRWWGRHVGDYPLPAGFTKEDMGKCDHAIALPNNSTAYEVGVCRRRDGKPGYTLVFDFYGGGKGLVKAVGNDAVHLKARYAEATAISKLRAKGCRVVREQRVVNGRRKTVLRAMR